MEIGFQYSPGAHANGAVATGPRHTFATGSHHPFGQSRGCAEPVAAVAIEKAAIGPAAAARTITREMILLMRRACPNSGRGKPLGDSLTG